MQLILIDLYAGIGGILVMGFGIFFSGVYIRLMKPSPKFVAAWIALTALLYAIGTHWPLFRIYNQFQLDFIPLFPCRYGPLNTYGLSHGRLCRNRQNRQVSTAKWKRFQSCLELFGWTCSGMELSMPCNRTCECDDTTFAPICTSEAQTYFSPCHAGCSSLSHLGNQVGELEVFSCSIVMLYYTILNWINQPHYLLFLSN